MHVVFGGTYPQDPNSIQGGVDAALLYLVRALAKHPDLRLSVVTLTPRGSERRTANHNGVEVHYLPTSKQPSYLSALKNNRELRDAMRRLEPDLIHAQVAGEFAEAAAVTGFPWVLTLHGIRHLEVDLWKGLRARYYKGFFVKRSERRSIEAARHVISISPYIREVFGNQMQGRIYDIENAIDSAFFDAPSEGDPKCLLFVGRLIPRKGVLTLLHAFAKLHKRLPDTTLRIAGGDSYSNEIRQYGYQLRNFVKQSGLEGAVAFLGPVDKNRLLEEYRHSAVVVLASIQETTPMVIAEAMAVGNAVVSTDCGGVRYMVEDGETGRVVPIDDPSALSDALYDVLADTQRLEAMISRGRSVARERFHANFVAAQTREVYYNVLGQPVPPQTDGRRGAACSMPPSDGRTPHFTSLTGFPRLTSVLA
jgi:glycosyltransferase involved in cell wall biosynthesis